MDDMINKPPHYTDGDIEPINVIEDWDLGYKLGNTVKYIKRYRKKGGIQDLEKALWYLNRTVAQEKAVIAGNGVVVVEEVQDYE